MSKSHIQEEEQRFFCYILQKELTGQGFKHGSSFLYSCCCDIKLDHGCFSFLEESLKVEIFFIFLVPLY